MKKTLFWKDDFSINELNDSLVKSKNIIQAIVVSFAQTGIQITGIEQLSGLVDNRRKLNDKNLEDFVFNQLFPDTPAGFQREKYREMVQMPDLTSVKESFEPLTGYFGGMHLPDVIHWQVFTIQNGEVGFIENEQQKLASNFQEFAETQIEHDRLTAVQDVCNALNKLIEFAGDHPVNYTIKGLIAYDESQAKFVPARLFIKTGFVSSGQFIANQNKPDSFKSSPEGKKQAVISAEASDSDRAIEFAKARNS